MALCGGKPKEPSWGGKTESSVVVTREDEDVLGPLPGAAEASAKPNSVKRVQTLSGGADLSTIPDDLQEALSEFDIDGGGVLRVDDIVQAAKLYRDSQDVRKKLYKLLLGLGVFVFILLGAITGLTAAMVELSKDTKPDASGTMTLKGSDTLAKVDNPGLSVGNSSQQVSFHHLFFWFLFFFSLGGNNNGGTRSLARTSTNRPSSQKSPSLASFHTKYRYKRKPHEQILVQTKTTCIHAHAHFGCTCVLTWLQRAARQ